MTVTARPDTWMPIFWGDYLKDTQHLDCQSHGGYLLLIAQYWTKGEALPDNDKYLRNVVGVTAQKWTTMRPILEPFFILQDGVWYHQRIDAELDKALVLTNKRRAASRAGHEARYGKDYTSPDKIVRDRQPETQRQSQAPIAVPLVENSAVPLAEKTGQKPSQSHAPSPSPNKRTTQEADPVQETLTLASAIGSRLSNDLGYDAARRLGDFSPITAWLNAGISEIQIVTTVLAVTASRRAKLDDPNWKPADLRYFDRPVREALKPQSPGNGGTASKTPLEGHMGPTSAELRVQRVLGFIQRGFWLASSWGEQPGEEEIAKIRKRHAKELKS